MVASAYTPDGRNATLRGLPQQCCVSIHRSAGRTDSRPNTSVDWSAESAKSGQHRSLMIRTAKRYEAYLQPHRNTAECLEMWINLSKPLKIVMIKVQCIPVRKFSCFWRDPSIPVRYNYALPTTGY
jgi:hypothetical protein